MERKLEQELRRSIDILIIDRIMVVLTIHEWVRWIRRPEDAGHAIVSTLEAAQNQMTVQVILDILS